MTFDYITVSLVTVTTDPDQYGDTAETYTITPVDLCLFAPRSSTERSDPRQPTVITGGMLYLPYGAPAPGPDDVIALPPGAHLDDDGKPVYDGPAYAVDGEAGVWGTAGIEVAVKRWRQQS